MRLKVFLVLAALATLQEIQANKKCACIAENIRDLFLWGNDPGKWLPKGFDCLGYNKTHPEHKVELQIGKVSMMVIGHGVT